MCKARSYKALVLVFFVLLFTPKQLIKQEFDADIFVDDAARQVKLPSQVKKVYATTEAGLFLLYAIEPESIIGWNRGLSPELEFAIQPQYHTLPTLGTWSLHYKTIQKDLIRQLKPDLIFHYAAPTKENIQLTTEIEETLGIPVILLDDTLTALPVTLSLLGQLLGKEVRGQALGSYVSNTLAKLADFQGTRRGFEPIPVHIVAENQTNSPKRLLKLAGMVEMPSWRNEPPFPDLILVPAHDFLDPYSELERFGYKKIYQIPAFPLNWLEEGSLFSLLGVEWLHSIAYPGEYQFDLSEAYRMFMEIFFQINVSPEVLDWTLKRSGISY